jgi:hypothetical protein
MKNQIKTVFQALVTCYVVVSFIVVFGNLLIEILSFYFKS